METGKHGFVFFGNQTALDFVNTEVVVRKKRISLLQEYADWKAWLIEANAVEAERLIVAEANWSEEARAKIFADALDLRTRLRTAADRIATGEPVEATTIDAINALLRHPVGYSQIETTEEGYRRRLYFDPIRPTDLLAPLAEAASDLLCNRDPALIRKCENPDCILYFYDNSKNHARRWCSMSVCGNRMKAAAHYQRKRKDDQLEDQREVPREEQQEIDTAETL